MKTLSHLRKLESFFGNMEAKQSNRLKLEAKSKHTELMQGFRKEIHLLKGQQKYTKYVQNLNAIRQKYYLCRELASISRFTG